MAQFCRCGETVYAPARDAGERKLVRVRFPLSAPISAGGGISIHASLRNSWARVRAGANPVPPTNFPGSEGEDTSLQTESRAWREPWLRKRAPIVHASGGSEGLQGTSPVFLPESGWRCSGYSDPRAFIFGDLHQVIVVSSEAVRIQLLRLERLHSCGAGVGSIPTGLSRGP